ITATDTATASFTDSATVTVAANVAASLTLTAPASTTAGNSFGITVTARDAYGNTASGYTGEVGFSGGGTGATVPGSYTFRSGTLAADDNGSHNFSGVVLKKAGGRSIAETDAVLGSRNDAARVRVAAATVAGLKLAAP